MADDRQSIPKSISSVIPGGVGRSDTLRTMASARTDAPSVSVARATIAELATPAFYKQESWEEIFLETLFKINERNSSFKAEVYYGIIHYISCFYCLAVVPHQLSLAGYDARSVFIATAACSGIGSLISGLFANLPFVVAPPTVVSIFFSVYLQGYKGKVSSIQSLGGTGVIISGLALILLGYRPLSNLIGRFIPFSIQAGTAIGIGLLTALAGAVDVDMVQVGTHGQLLQFGPLTNEVIITIAGVIIICISAHYHIQGGFCLAIIVCSIIFGICSGDWPKGVGSVPLFDIYQGSEFHNSAVPLLVVELLFLYILYLNGLVSSLSYLAGLTRDDGAIPRGRWIFILTGVMTITSGLIGGAPVLISPESAAAVKEGAKTGLSTCVCGALFFLSIFFAPIFEAIPSAGTSPILLMIGTLLFQNVLRVDWKYVRDSTPAFIVLFFIPFTYSVIQGVILGYAVYVCVGLFTGTLTTNAVVLSYIYFPSLSRKYLPPDPRIKMRHSSHSASSPGDMANMLAASAQATSRDSRASRSSKMLDPRSLFDEDLDGDGGDRGAGGGAIGGGGMGMYLSMGFQDEDLFELRPVSRPGSEVRSDGSGSGSVSVNSLDVRLLVASSKLPKIGETDGGSDKSDIEANIAKTARGSVHSATNPMAANSDL